MNKSDQASGGWIVGVGSALVDILCHEPEGFPEQSGVQKGGMTYVESLDIDRVLMKTTCEPVIVAGGSACNTIVGLGMMGAKARFVGKLGDDKTGALFEAGVKQSGAGAVLIRSKSPTGRVLSIITPDAQRSMLTFLGASAELEPADVTASCFADAAVVLLEGYLVFNETLLRHAVATAKGAGAKIALDLASFTVVSEKRALLNEIVDNFVDILIANEDEARVFTGESNDDAAFRKLAPRAEIVVMKRGKEGSKIARGSEVVEAAAVTGGPVVDTTGAGDLWAAGFLFGLTNGFSLAGAGALASRCGCEVCPVDGAASPEAAWTQIRKEITILKEKDTGR